MRIKKFEKYNQRGIRHVLKLSKLAVNGSAINSGIDHFTKSTVVSSSEAKEYKLSRFQ